MPVSHAFRALFVHIPKCGGSSIERALDMHGDWRVEDRARLFGRATSADLRAIAGSVGYLQHLDAWQLRRAAGEQAAGYLSFAFVRHPLDRLVSAWAGRDPDLLACARAQGVDLRGLDFARFVDATVGIDHPHLATQSSFIVEDDGTLAVGFLGRFERFAEDFAALCERLAIPAEHRPALPHAHRSRHESYLEHSDVRSRTIALRRYRVDFERFGYDF